ncbi:MAG: response regulator transcription factor [Solirubrobacteraceae bacterium]
MSDLASTILLVDGNRVARGSLAEQLCADGYNVLEAGAGGSALKLLESQFVDAAVIDRALADGDGLGLLTAIRGAGTVAARLDVDLPIIMTSAGASWLDRVRGLERGCDDYLASPFPYPELHARLVALLRRRVRMAVGARLRVGPLEVNALARQAWVDGRALALSGKEFSLLQTLAREPTRVFSREELMVAVWGWAGSGRAGYRTRTLDQHASRLRRKLAVHGVSFVVNVWGVGYRLLDMTQTGAVGTLAQVS